MVSKAVLVVDPEGKTWSDSLKQALSSDFDVIHTKNPDMAFASFRAIRPWATVTRLNLGNIHGLQLTRMIRHQAGGRKCLIIVFGKPKKSDNLPQASEIKKYWPVDHFIPEAKTKASDIALLLGAHTRLPKSVILQRAKDVDNSTSSQLAARLGVDLEHDEIDWKDLIKQKVSSSAVRALLQKPVNIIEAEEVEENQESLTWKQILAQEITKEGLLSVLSNTVRRNITVDKDFDEMTWVELLHQDVSLESLATLLTKDLIENKNPSKPE